MMAPELSRALALGYQRLPELKEVLDTQKAEELEQLLPAVRWVFARDEKLGEQWMPIVRKFL